MQAIAYIIGKQFYYNKVTLIRAGRSQINSWMTSCYWQCSLDRRRLNWDTSRESQNSDAVSVTRDVNRLMPKHKEIAIYKVHGHNFTEGTITGSTIYWTREQWYTITTWWQWGFLSSYMATIASVAQNKKERIWEVCCQRNLLVAYARVANP